MTHKQISYIKSIVRIIGYLFLLSPCLCLGVIILIISELFGIFEEKNE